MKRSSLVLPVALLFFGSLMEPGVAAPGAVHRRRTWRR